MHTESDRIALEALMGLVSVPGASKNKKQRQEKDRRLLYVTLARGNS
jgi:hypothetical protein